jgi:hypothetical protein
MDIRGFLVIDVVSLIIARIRGVSMCRTENAATIHVPIAAELLRRAVFSTSPISARNNRFS